MKPASVFLDLPSASRILLLRLRSLGDIVLLTPALRLLKKWRPELQISVVIETRFHALLKGNPHLDEVLSPGEGNGSNRVLGRIRAVQQLRSRKFALCLNLHGGPTSVFLARFSGARWKAGFEHFRSRSLYDFAIPDARAILGKPIVHTAEHQAAAFFWLGMPRQPIPPAEIFVSPNWNIAWHAERARLGVAPEQGYALIHPAALYPTKQWPAARFAELGRYLGEHAGLVPIFSCGPGESHCVEEVERAAQHPIRRLEGPHLGTFIAAIAGARLFVGNDSGPAHIAAALRKPLVVIFGSSNSQIWGPWAGAGPGGREFPGGSATAFRVVQNFYECNPCRGDRCYRFERPECILSVTAEQVRSAVDSVLSPLGRT